MAVDHRAAALFCLTAIVLTAIAGLTVVAVFTDRELRDAGMFTLAIALCVAVLGGFNTFRHHYRWRVERKDIDSQEEDEE